MKNEILSRFQAFEGDVSLLYKNLATGETFSYNDAHAHPAASIIKIPIMVEVFRRFECKEMKKSDMLTLNDSDRVPPCGVLTFMHTGMQVSLMDLVWLMITISDNVATNMLIDHLGIEAIQSTAVTLDLRDTVLERKLFESSPTKRHLRNRISARDMALLLQMMHRGELISRNASKDMLEVLSVQQLNNKMPLLLPLDCHVAHKTGEDTDITHDVGIVYAKQPFIACFCGSNVSAPDYNLLIAEVTKQLTDACGGIG